MHVKEVLLVTAALAVAHAFFVQPSRHVHPNGESMPFQSKKRVRSRIRGPSWGTPTRALDDDADVGLWWDPSMPGGDESYSQSSSQTSDVSVSKPTAHQPLPTITLDVASSKGRAVDPFAGPPTVYRDNWFDKIALKIICMGLAASLGESIQGPITYDTFIELARKIQLANPAPADQRMVALTALKAVIPTFIFAVYKAIFPPSKITSEVNAFMVGPMFSWMIGPSTVEEGLIDVVDSDGNVTQELWKSTIKVERCRYLEAGQCKGACMNLCKVPTETFFREEFGALMRMEPDFEDLSCKFIFGATAIPVDEDPLMKEPCWAECPSLGLARKLSASNPEVCMQLGPAGFEPEVKRCDRLVLSWPWSKHVFLFTPSLHCPMLSTLLHCTLLLS
ncbi:unnamed protein product [Chrysoparadoxa australica]